MEIQLEDNSRRAPVVAAVEKVGSIGITFCSAAAEDKPA